VTVKNNYRYLPRHARAKAQIEASGTTPALKKYLKDSLDELAVLRANDLEMEQAEKN